VFIREHVLPKNLNVTSAAKLLGVGRPALSRLLNGRASLSSEMAVRIEKAFRFDSDRLLKLQAAFDRAEAQEKEPEIAVRAYAPSVMDVKAMQIEAWSEAMPPRSDLAALLRRLVHSTAENVSQVDFPAYENAQRPGWDGFIRAGAATPWIPLGDSGWEFSVDRDPRGKAEEVYQARKVAIPEDKRAQTTFVFVTTRNWTRKADWVAEKTVEKKWKGVRVYDASDLEQWIETSLPAQAWFSDRLPLRSRDLLDLEGAWRRWANAAHPILSKRFFEPIAGSAAKPLAQWLRQPPERPFTVVADSRDEALAALACTFDTPPLADGPAKDRVVVVEAADTVAKLASATSSFTVILASEEAQVAAGGQFRQRHTIVVVHRNNLEEPADLAVDLVDGRTFREALADMGVAHDQADRLERESGRSLTVLRRRLALMPALKAPPWSENHDWARTLIPLMMAGAWSSTSEADQTVVTSLADRPYDDVEATVAGLVGEPDTPLWSIGAMRGVVSKTDAFYAIQRFVTAADLHRFFDVSFVVLSEENPALELPADQQWAAPIYGKTRRHSGVLRQSLCETLVLLSVHGDNLFRARLGFDVVAEVNRLIRRLLTPLDGATWRSQQHDLPRYAEAAPDVFLDLLENDLRSDNPKVHALLSPARSGPFESPGRTGLLWALESLAWNSDRLFRVVSLLAKLAEVQISDNWMNKPENSLASIFRCWMPQTAAPVDLRIKALELLTRRFPSIGWRICLNQFDPHSIIGHYNAKPRWRADAAGAGEPARGDDYLMARRAALELALSWPSHNEKTLGDLVERLEGIPDDQDAVWNAILAWVQGRPTDEAKAELRERIRRSTMIRRPRQSPEAAPPVSPRARAIYDVLEPQDLIWRHHWLFAQQRVQESPEELQDQPIDFSKREARVERRRLEALTEIWLAHGFEGVRELCGRSEAPAVIGGLLAKVLNRNEVQAVALEIVEGDSAPKLDLCLSGLMRGLSAETRDAIYEEALAAGSSQSQFTPSGLHRLMLSSPFDTTTWSRLNGLPAEQQDRYWADVLPQPLFRDEPETANRVVDELLRARRPRAAFASVHLAFGALSTDRLMRLLHDAATVDAEPQGHYRLSPHDISPAFEVLSERSDADPDAIARLEVAYINVLSDTLHGIRNLERQLAESPSLFVQALSFVYRRKDGAEDPPELRLEDEQAARRRAETSYSLLSGARRLPGLNDRGEMDHRKLRNWIVDVRALGREYGREEAADSHIGQLLAHSPTGGDGVWPLEVVREVLEDVGTQTISNGMLMGRVNSRGATWRGEDGAQERDLAEQYRDWSSRVAAEHPFTARLLANLAASYDREAEWYDDRSRISKRIPY
jgi:addiction module HigA family antidote